MPAPQRPRSPAADARPAPGCRWPRLVRWQAQDEEGVLLRDQLRQAAELWQDRNRPADLLWTGTSFNEFQIWRERYPGGLTAAEEAFGVTYGDGEAHPRTGRISLDRRGGSI